MYGLRLTSSLRVIRLVSARWGAASDILGTEVLMSAERVFTVFSLLACFNHTLSDFKNALKRFLILQLNRFQISHN